MNNNYLTGIFPGMPNAEYHDHLHMGSSGFKLLRRSPLHFWTASPLNPDRVRRPASRVMNMGTAWHTGIWEPHLFAASYGVKPELHAASTVYKLLQEALEDFDAFRARHVAIPDGVTKTSKEGKALLAELEADGKVGIEQSKLDEVLGYVPGLLGRILFSQDDFDDVKLMSDAAHAHPTTQVLFSVPGGMHEVSIFAVDAETGAPCRIRPDFALPPGAMAAFPNGLIIDGKSTDDASDDEFGRTAWNGEMFYQAAFYTDVFQQAFKTPGPPAFAWLGQERDAPYATKFHSAPANLVEYGRRKYRPLLQRFADCLRTGEWPGYPHGVKELPLPAYAAKTISETLAA